MRSLLVLLLLASAARAQEVECPKRLPGIEAPKARLTGAGMYQGAEKQYELVGERTNVAGGYDVQYGFRPNDIRWLACAYDEKYIWWEWMDPKTTSCKLQERKVAGGVSVKLACK
ncbi:MAG TPA: STY0301 family protein [Telluria sp.]